MHDGVVCCWVFNDLEDARSLFECEQSTSCHSDVHVCEVELGIPGAPNQVVMCGVIDEQIFRFLKLGDDQQSNAESEEFEILR